MIEHVRILSEICEQIGKKLAPVFANGTLKSVQLCPLPAEPSGSSRGGPRTPRAFAAARQTETSGGRPFFLK